VATAKGFDVDAFRAAHQPWSFTVGGRTFGARHVSAVAVQRYEQMRVVAGKDAKRQQRALRWLLRRAFPWRLSYRLRGDPVTLILGLEPAAQRAALIDFFACLSGRTAPPLTMTKATPTNPRTSGIGSLGSTPPLSP